MLRRMDHATARAELNRQLATLAERRTRAQSEIDRAACEIGATATYLRDVLDQPKARSAEFAGVSPSHMTELMRIAADQDVTIDDPLRRVPFLQGADLQKYVNERGGPWRVVASFADSDSMYMAGLDPTSLLDARYGGLHLPKMLIQSRNEDWVAVDNVTVGYNGTGPSNAHRELTGLGLDPDLVHQIAYTRVTDIDLDQPSAAVSTNRWPHTNLAAPTPVGDYFVVVVSVEDPSLRSTRSNVHNINGPRAFEETHNGFYPTLPTEPALDRWLTVLDDPTAPAWLRGPRRSRVYLDRGAARESGYCREQLTPWQTSFGIYPVVIEQGRLQLWLDIPTSNDPSILFTPETYAALDKAGFYTKDFQARDEQHSFWRWLRSVGAQRPTFVDLNDIPLRHSPPTPSRLGAGHQ